MRRIAGGVDANGMLGAAAHLDEFALALRRDAALAPGLLNQLAPLERVDVAGGLGVDELEDGVVIHIRIFVDITRFLPSFLSRVAPQNRIQARDARLQRLLAKLIDAVAAADNARHLARIRSGQPHDLAVLVQIRHLHAEAVGISTDGFNVFLYDLLCFFLWIFHIYPPYRFRMRPAFPGPFPLLSKPKFGADAGDQPAVFQRL